MWRDRTAGYDELSPEQNVHNFAVDILTCIFDKKNEIYISIQTSLKFDTRCPVEFPISDEYMHHKDSVC